MERVVDFASSTISCDDTAAAVSSPSPSPLIRSKRRLARMCGAVFLRSATVAVVVSRFGCCGISAPRFLSVIFRIFISGTTRDLKNPPDACMSVTSVGQACVANIASSVVVVLVVVCCCEHAECVLPGIHSSPILCAPSHPMASAASCASFSVAYICIIIVGIDSIIVSSLRDSTTMPPVVVEVLLRSTATNTAAVKIATTMFFICVRLL
mmetsp:Transcript_11687/g.26473  ORF Transcript_11687/g.26473 Transcript_11687/m.26473 type:complete len:210 (+) Transcript_11687:1399-2028(+)